MQERVNVGHRGDGKLLVIDAVHVPTDKDDSVKEYLRMRDDHKLALKKIKQQINAFCIRHGYFYPGTKWTIKHLQWLRKLALKDRMQIKTAPERDALVPSVLPGIFCSLRSSCSRCRGRHG